MKIRRKSVFPVMLILCAIAFASCDTYYYGVKETRHHSKVNGEKTMYVHRQTVDGTREFGKSRSARPAAMYKQKKIIR